MIDAMRQPPSWASDLERLEGPRYERIADAIGAAIRSGHLKAGERLPTLKDLAGSLGITPGTVARAYELAQRKGLIEGEVGRGTFVLPIERVAEATSAPVSGARPPERSVEVQNDWVDLSIVKPNLQLQEPNVRAALMELSQSAVLSEMLDYTPDGGHPLHRQAGAEWMRHSGLPVRHEQVLLTAGAQHGLLVAVNALTRPGDLILCESLCYPGVASVAHSLGRRLVGVRVDRDGMDPSHLRELVMADRPALVICIATCQNPTASVMPAGRRREIAELAREFDFALVDDDIYGFLAPEPVAPLATFAPERTLYLTSLSKSVLSTVRLGYLHCPAEWLARLTASVRTTIWMVSPLAAQLATTLINSGKAQEMAMSQREEARARQTLVRELLGGFEYTAQPTSFHVWLKLPPSWTSGDQFAGMARGHQLLVAAGDAFSMNRDGEGRQHVRISVMAGSRDQMRFVLTKLGGLISTPDTVWL